MGKIFSGGNSSLNKTEIRPGDLDTKQGPKVELNCSQSGEFSGSRTLKGELMRPILSIERESRDFIEIERQAHSRRAILSSREIRSIL